MHITEGTITRLGLDELTISARTLIESLARGTLGQENNLAKEPVAGNLIIARLSSTETLKSFQISFGEVDEGVRVKTAQKCQRGTSKLIQHLPQNHISSFESAKAEEEPGAIAFDTRKMLTTIVSIAGMHWALNVLTSIQVALAYKTGNLQEAHDVLHRHSEQTNSVWHHDLPLIKMLNELLEINKEILHTANPCIYS